MTSVFPVELLVKKIKENRWDKDLDKLYKWPLRNQLVKLKDVCKEMDSDSTKWLNDLLATPVDSDKKEPTFAMTLTLRKHMQDMLRNGRADKSDEIAEIKKIKVWIVKDWGGIQLRHEQSEPRLFDCIEKAVSQDKVEVKHNARNVSEKKKFTIDRIPSWSKYLAFKFPQRYAIYDARVIYSLNWLLLKTKTGKEEKKLKIGEEGAFKFFPFLEGQNSVMGLLNYDIHLLLSHYHENVLRDSLKKDIESRSMGENVRSSLRSKLEKGLFIYKQEAYSEYCDLLIALAESIYPDNTDTHRLTKIEMILFAIADKAIAENVMDSLTGKNSASVC